MKSETDRITIGIDKYSRIMQRLYTVDVSADSEFQKLFNAYYRIRQRPATFYKTYYTYLEKNKHNHTLTFSEVLTHLYQETGAIHASFSSKLLATVNPDMPIWDQFVLQNLGLRTPYYYEKNRLQKTILLYQKIYDWYHTEDAVEALDFFNKNFPNTTLSDVKKIDFVLWTTR